MLRYSGEPMAHALAERDPGHTPSGQSSSRCVTTQISLSSPGSGTVAGTNTELTYAAISVPGPRGGGEQPMTLAPKER
jgi:hypothetical protein